MLYNIFPLHASSTTGANFGEHVIINNKVYTETAVSPQKTHTYTQPANTFDTRMNELWHVFHMNTHLKTTLWNITPCVYIRATKLKTEAVKSQPYSSTTRHFRPLRTSKINAWMHGMQAKHTVKSFSCKINMLCIHLKGQTPK